MSYEKVHEPMCYKHIYPNEYSSCINESHWPSIYWFLWSINGIWQKAGEGNSCRWNGKKPVHTAVTHRCAQPTGSESASYLSRTRERRLPKLSTLRAFLFAPRRVGWEVFPGTLRAWLWAQMGRGYDYSPSEGLCDTTPCLRGCGGNKDEKELLLFPYSSKGPSEANLR